jgi:hypothetical protein
MTVSSDNGHATTLHAAARSLRHRNEFHQASTRRAENLATSHLRRAPVISSIRPTMLSTRIAAARSTTNKSTKFSHLIPQGGRIDCSNIAGKGVKIQSRNGAQVDMADEDTALIAPGLLPSHYAPRGCDLMWHHPDLMPENR